MNQIPGSMYFCYFVIISRWKRTRSFICTNFILIPFSLVFFVPSLVKIGPVVLEKDDNQISSMYFQCFFSNSVIISPWKKGGALYKNKLE